jgi:hypothetical protein
VGGKAEEIILWPLGGLAFLSHDSGPKGDLWVTLAGPLTHVPQAAIWWVIAYLMDSNTFIKSPNYSSAEFGLSIVWAAFWVRFWLQQFSFFLWTCVELAPDYSPQCQQLAEDVAEAGRLQQERSSYALQLSFIADCTVFLLPRACAQLVRTSFVELLLCCS